MGPRLASVRIRGELGFPARGSDPDRSWALELTVARAGGLRARGYNSGGAVVFEIASDGRRMQVQELGANRRWEGDALSTPQHDPQRPWLSLRPLDLVDALLPRPLPVSRDGLDSGNGPAVVVEDHVDGAVVLWMDTGADGIWRSRRRTWLRGNPLQPWRVLHFDGSGRPRLDVRIPSGVDSRYRLPLELTVLRPSDGVEYHLSVDDVVPEPVLEAGMFRIAWRDGALPAPLPVMSHGEPYDGELKAFVPVVTGLSTTDLGLR